MDKDMAIQILPVQKRDDSWLQKIPKEAIFELGLE